MGFRAPNYTQVPNELLDEWLPKLKLVETRVLLVLTRKIIGWHKHRDKVSLRQLMKATGSEKIHILKAVRSLEKLGLIRTEKNGEIGNENTYYELVVDEDSNNLDGCLSDTGGGVFLTPTKERPTKEREIPKGISSCPSPGGLDDNAVFSPDVDELTSELVESIKKSNPKAKIPKDIKPWRQSIDRMMRLDGHTADEIRLVIRQLALNSFWSSVILSAQKLREKFPTLWKQFTEMEKSTPGKSEFHEENKKLAESHEAEWRNLEGGRLHAGPKQVEIASGARDAYPICIAYTEHGFSDQLDNALRKKGYKKQQRTNK